MYDSGLRKAIILTELPAHPSPRNKTIKQIKDLLEDHYGIRTSERSIQRDMIELSRVFPLITSPANDPRYHGPGWSLAKVVIKG